MGDQQRTTPEILNRKLQKYLQRFPIKLRLPANILGKTSNGVENFDNNGFRDLNSKKFVNNRLLETNIEFNSNEPTPLSAVSESLQSFVSDLEKCGSYESVQVVLSEAKDVNGNSGNHQLDVILNEKNWYKLYMGGGMKQDQSLSSLIPKFQFVSNASLINLTGNTDATQLNYSLDQSSIPTFTFTHTRPLYSLFQGSLENYILGMDEGSKIGVTVKACIDTTDFSDVRSSRDHIRKFGMKISNSTIGSSSSGNVPAQNGVYYGAEWSLALRDVIPRRHITFPYQYDSSPEIISASGPTFCHSILTDFRLNGYLTDSRYQPTAGIDSYGSIQLSGPPGDLGFLKASGGAILHLPITAKLSNEYKQKIGLLRRISDGVSIHTAVNGGFLMGMNFGKLCSSSTTFSDRFYVGGSHQLRGFMSSGIGPRTRIGGSSTPGGDALGGELFYTVSQFISMPFPGNEWLSSKGVRVFCFANVGTLTTSCKTTCMRSFLGSSRVAFGYGISAGLPMGRIEATYSFPYRFGPLDARSTLQAGIGFNFG